jgi:hypothetical protein
MMSDLNANPSALEPLNLGRILTAMLICALILLLYLFLLVGCAFLIGSDAVVCFQFMYFRDAGGIPSAIIASISIVALLAAGVGGEFKIKLWGLSLEGPSAPITMWIVCFLSITLALYSLFSEVKTVEALPPALSKFCKSS